MTEPIFTPAQEAEIDAYHFPLYVWQAAGGVLVLLLASAAIAFLVRPLYRFAQRSADWLEARFGGLRRAPVANVPFELGDKLWGEPGWGAALLFAVYDLLLWRLAMLPAAIYFGYVHEHRFGLSRYTPGAFALDLFKSTVLKTLFTAMLVFGLFGLARRFRRWWLALGAFCAALLLVSSAIDPFRSVVYLEREPLADGPLRQRIFALLEKAGVEVRDIVVEKTSTKTVKVQAYFAGQGATRTIVLNDALLENMTDDEVLAAVAHEAAHVKEPRWPRWLASSLGLFAFLYLVHRLFAAAAERTWYGVTRYGDVRVLPAIGLAFYVATSLAVPALAAWSRDREREADAAALRLTGDGHAFRRMLVKAARVNKMDPNPPRWVVWLGRSHPPVGERIAAVDAWLKKEAGDR